MKKKIQFNFCGQTELGGLALTRARAERECRDAAAEGVCGALAEKEEIPSKGFLGNKMKPEQKQEMELCNCLSKVNHSLKIKSGDKLIDANYETKCDFILDRKTYVKMLSHMF